MRIFPLRFVDGLGPIHENAKIREKRATLLKKGAKKVSVPRKKKGFGKAWPSTDLVR